VQLIDGRGFYERMPRSLGEKRHRVPNTGIEAITRLFAEFKENDKSLVLDNATFGYYRIVIERPLRLRYELSEDALATLVGEKGFLRLDAETREKVAAALEGAVANGAPSGTDPSAFASAIKEIVASVDGFDPKQVSTIAKLVATAGTVRDPEAPIVVDRKGNPLPDPELRDYEQVPFGEDIDEYVEREVKPYLPDAWVDHTKTRVGYEIPLTRFFHRFEEPRPLEEIDNDIKALEGEILELLRGVTE
jgi:type I restriction enzyme M protein